jgi:hypothetical protein
MGVRALPQVSDETRDKHIRVWNAVSLRGEIPNLEDLLQRPDVKRDACGTLGQRVVTSSTIKDYAVGTSEDFLVDRLDKDITAESLAVGLQFPEMVLKVDKRLAGSSLLAGDS